MQNPTRPVWRKMLTTFAIAAALSFGVAGVARHVIHGACCFPGMPCCYPGSPCCHLLSTKT